MCKSSSTGTSSVELCVVQISNLQAASNKEKEHIAIVVSVHLHVQFQTLELQAHSGHSGYPRDDTYPCTFHELQNSQSFSQSSQGVSRDQTPHHDLAIVIFVSASLYELTAQSQSHSCFLRSLVSAAIAVLNVMSEAPEIGAIHTLGYLGLHLCRNSSLSPVPYSQSVIHFSQWASQAAIRLLTMTSKSPLCDSCICTSLWTPYSVLFSSDWAPPTPHSEHHKQWSEPPPPSPCASGFWNSGSTPPTEAAPHCDTCFCTCMWRVHTEVQRQVLQCEDQLVFAPLCKLSIQSSPPQPEHQPLLTVRITGSNQNQSISTLRYLPLHLCINSWLSTVSRSQSFSRFSQWVSQAAIRASTSLSICLRSFKLRFSFHSRGSFLALMASFRLFTSFWFRWVKARFSSSKLGNPGWSGPPNRSFRQPVGFLLLRFSFFSFGSFLAMIDLEMLWMSALLNLTSPKFSVSAEGISTLRYVSLHLCMNSSVSPVPHSQSSSGSSLWASQAAIRASTSLSMWLRSLKLMFRYFKWGSFPPALIALVSLCMSDLLSCASFRYSLSTAATCLNGSCTKTSFSRRMSQNSLFLSPNTGGEVHPK